MFSAANTGTGYGTLSYTASTGEFSFAKVTSANIRAQFTGGNGISIAADGEITADLGSVQAGSAAQVTVTEKRSDAGTWYPAFASGTTGTKSLFMDDEASSGLKYVPSSSTLTATNFSGTASSANYADLAEKYVADVAYEPGTV